MQKQSGTYQGIAWTAEVHHLRDRWTGQAWMVIYGLDPEKKEWYSGERILVPPRAEVGKRIEQVLERSGQKARRDALISQIAECNRTKSIYEEAQRQYEVATRVGKPLSQAQIESYRIWKEANAKSELLAAELADLERKAEETVISELTPPARQKEKLATVVWGGLVVISAVAACVMYFSRSAVKTH
ncbi:MAG: hypothetical protein ACPL5F_14590 [Moorellaceae bacterium]